MKKITYCLIVFLVLAIANTGCSKEIQDRPLPMSQDNLEKLTNELQKAVKSIAPNPNQDRAELVANAYKTVVERKMGYSFDKTLRNVMLFYPIGTPWQLMSPVIGYVIKDPKKSLDNGLISQRTYEILDIASKAKTKMTKEDEEFLGFVVECQNLNNGVCDPKALMNVLDEKNILPETSPGDPEFIRLGSINSQLEKKYDIFHLGINHWLTQPDGQEINTNGLFERKGTFKFVINAEQIKIAKQYAEIVAEEQTALSR